MIFRSRAMPVELVLRGVAGLCTGRLKFVIYFIFWNFGFAILEFWNCGLYLYFCFEIYFLSGYKKGKLIRGISQIYDV